MKYQVSSLSDKWLKSIFVTSEIEDYGLEKLHEGYYQVVFFSPEALLCNASWRDIFKHKLTVYQENIVALVIRGSSCKKVVCYVKVYVCCCLIHAVA